MNKKKLINMITSKKAVPLLALLVLASAFGITWAFYSDSKALANPLNIGHSGAAIQEEFNPDSSFLPGEIVSKVVTFKNTGNMDIYLRVRAEPQEGWYMFNGNKQVELTFGKADADSDELIKDGVKHPLLDLDKVIKNWSYGEENVFGKGIPDGKSNNDWIKIGDYCYYRHILTPDQVTGPILNSIQLSPSVSNDRHAVNYSDKIYKLDFMAEATPVVEGLASVEIWGVDVEENSGTLDWSRTTS